MHIGSLALSPRMYIVTIVMQWGRLTNISLIRMLFIHKFAFSRLMSQITTNFKLTSTMHGRSSLPSIFLLYDKCYWCATYLDKTRIPIDNSCPKCHTESTELSSFPIVNNESFTIGYSEKRGVELKFILRSG